MALTTNLIDYFNDQMFNEENISEFGDLFNLMPFSIYWKDVEGGYLGRNRSAAEHMVFQEHEEKLDVNYVIRKTDRDFFDSDTAESFRQNDLIAINNPDRAHHFVEGLFLPNGEKIEQISIKRCLLNQYAEPVGTLSCTIN